MMFRWAEGLRSESFHQKLDVQSDFEDVENSEFDWFFGENFRFKAPQLNEKSSERHVIHIQNIVWTQRYPSVKKLGTYDM